MWFFKRAVRRQVARARVSNPSQAERPLRLEERQYFVREVVDALLAAIEHELGLFGGLVRIIDAGESLELPCTGLLVQPFRVAGFADLDRRIDKDLNEFARFEQGSHRV